MASSSHRPVHAEGCPRHPLLALVAGGVAQREKVIEGLVYAFNWRGELPALLQLLVEREVSLASIEKE